MGYTTDFWGGFQVTPKLSNEDRIFLEKFNETRRMKRNLGPAYGVEGEFYVEGNGYRGQEDDLNIIDYNSPPRTQPGLWCQWRPDDDGSAIVWDGGEKFYNYIEWIQYLIQSILSPRGYTLTGEVEWRGEDAGDFGCIIIKNNVVSIKETQITYKTTTL